MPIYAYRCGACGHAQDVLQKMSDPLLTICPACGAEAYTKQVTAAGFQLKGSGWYVTDFRGGANAGAAAKDEAAPGGDKVAEKAGEKAGEKVGDKAADKSSDKAADKSGTQPAAAAGPAKAAEPAAKPAAASPPAAGG